MKRSPPVEYNINEALTEISMKYYDLMVRGWYEAMRDQLWPRLKYRKYPKRMYFWHRKQIARRK